MNIKDFGNIVASMSDEELAFEIRKPDRLRIGKAKAGRDRSRNVEMVWAPFDSMEREARIAIFGVTPGREQMGNALKAYRRARHDGMNHAAADRAGKGTGAFSGEMRETLIRILDEVRIPDFLGANSSTALWGDMAQKVHFSSVLRYPVFCDQKVEGVLKPLQNYTGSNPAITSLPMFQTMLKEVLVQEVCSLPEDCLIAPLGEAATKAMLFAMKGVPDFDRHRLLVGLPHPSGAARDVSSQFLNDPPSKTRVKPLNPVYRENALKIRNQIETLCL